MTCGADAAEEEEDMSRLSSRNDALEDISTWNSEAVVELLRENGVEEACWKAAEKRQIDGDELLHLTEGKLALWKNDLTRPLIWNLWTFVEELKKCPEKYVEQRQQQQQQSQKQEAAVAQPEPPQQQSPVGESGALSDASSWDTDFDDEEDEEDEEDGIATMPRANSDNFRNSLRIFQENDRASMMMMQQQNDSLKGSSYSLHRTDPANGAAPSPESAYANSNAPPTPESTYANCQRDAPQEAENTYMNTSEVSGGRNASRLHSREIASEQQKSLAEKLREQLIMLGIKPAVAPKPEGLARSKRSKDEVILRGGEPRSSFLHKSGPKVNGAGGLNGIQNGVSNKTTSPRHQQTEPEHPPAAASVISSSTSSRGQSSSEESLRNLPRPPVSIRSFDLVANLPTRRSLSDDDEEESYEPFDQRIVEQHSGPTRPESAQSASGTVGSVDSVYRPPSLAASGDADDEGVYELYESITEMPDDGRPVRKESSPSPPKVPPPLPAKPPRNIAMERSPSRQSAALPGASSSATRPLPPPPEKRESFRERAWFQPLTREEAQRLIEKRKVDGHFLLRPSTTSPDHPLTLVLWFKDKVYNIPVRRRPDNRYALGTPKSQEQSFESIDDIIPHFKSEPLVLSSNGVETGQTKLTDTPPKTIAK